MRSDDARTAAAAPTRPAETERESVSWRSSPTSTTKYFEYLQLRGSLACMECIAWWKGRRALMMIGTVPVRVRPLCTLSMDRSVNSGKILAVAHW